MIQEEHEFSRKGSQLQMFFFKYFKMRLIIGLEPMECNDFAAKKA
jgi:hypothetical protein